MKKITLNDIAARAGCSKATVSYVINRNHPIGDVVRRRVLDAIEELRYKPSVRHSKIQSKIIVLLCEKSDLGGVSSTIVSKCLERGYTPQICGGLTNLNYIRSALDSVSQLPSVVGIINMHPRIDSMELIRRSRFKHVITFARDNCMLSPITVFYGRRISLALEHLTGLGHRKIAFLIYQENIESPLAKVSIEETDRFVKRNPLCSCSIRVLPNEDPHTGDNIMAEGMTAMLDSGATAFICDTMMLARAVLRFAYRKKLRMPDDFSLLAFDNSGNAARYAPQLTVCTLPVQLMAEQTIIALEAIISGAAPKEFTVSPQLWIGESTGAPPA